MRSGEQTTAPTTVDDTYDARTLEATEGFVKYYEWVLHHIADSIHGATLEIGAGTGTMSDRIVPLCSELVLVEPAANLCRHLDERFADAPHVTACCGSLEQVVADRPELVAAGFDTIVSFNVHEHIEDDVGTLRTAATLLRPGAHLVLFVPSVPFLHGTIDAQVDHLRRYTKATLSAAVQSAGLELQRIEYFDILGMIPWLLVARTTPGFPWLAMRPLSYPIPYEMSYLREPVAGLLPNMPACVLGVIAFCVQPLRRLRRHAWVSTLIALLAITALLIVGTISFHFHGATMRYQIDYAPLLLMASVLGWCMFSQRLTAGTLSYRVLHFGAVVVVAWSAIFSIAITSYPCAGTGSC